MQERSMSSDAYICDGLRTPFGRYAGGLSAVRADNLGAIRSRALMEKYPDVEWGSVDDVLYGCANQGGEDNRNDGRMSSLWVGLLDAVHRLTLNTRWGYILT